MDGMQMADMIADALLGPRRKTYDPECYDLASKFLEDHPEINDGYHCSLLAASIQETIEREIEGMKS